MSGDTRKKPRRKTDVEIAAEVKRLREMKPKVRRYTFFGDDNWRKIDAQIEVLEEGLGASDIDDRYEDPDENSVAYEAFRWSEGEKCEDGSPSEQWKELVTK